MSRAQPASDYVSRSNTGMKNRIINGGMDIFQRGTSISSGLNAVTYVADRWIAYATGAAVTCVRSGGDGDFQYCLANTGAVGNTNVNFTQRIEATNAYCAVGTVMTVSFRVYSTDATTINYAVDTANTADVFTSTTALVNGAAGSVLAATWKTLSFSFTTNTACKNGFQITIGLGACGSGITRAITGVQLELGSIATPFEHRPYGTELALCQRYYETAPSTLYGMVWSPTTVPVFGWYFKVPKRSTTPGFVGSASSRLVGNSAIAAGGQLLLAGSTVVEAQITTTITASVGVYWIDSYGASFSAEL